MKIKALIIGGSGYIGITLIKILLNHPFVELIGVTSKTHENKNISEIYPSLLNQTQIKYSNLDQLNIIEVDIIFVALPHGKSMEKIPKLVKKFPKTKIIDLSGDYRLNKKEEYETYYNKTHCSFNIQENFVYGLAELNKEKIKKSSYIANPGCFATSVILALSPLVQNNFIDGQVIVDSKTGSSGSGKTPSLNTHHPIRTYNTKAYKLFNHQHTPEIKQALNLTNLIFTPHSIPLVKGIFSTHYVTLKKEILEHDLIKLYTNFYEKNYFIRIVKVTEVINVVNTNFCDISINKCGKNVIVTSAIDNLIKGGAGSAVQNMNIMFDLDEKTGLDLMGI